ncbi:MAG: hypothetical protein C5B49_15330 [Bdellovibrio sp.]|nr:MAG: hypothetical protein C5B49_15330 [Bdellovibrio sp.]
MICIKIKQFAKSLRVPVELARYILTLLKDFNSPGECFARTLCQDCEPARLETGMVLFKNSASLFDGIRTRRKKFFKKPLSSTKVLLISKGRISKKWREK